MDRETFDALTRFVSATGSRRAVVATLFGATLFGQPLASAAKKGRGSKGKGKGKGKGKKRKKTRAEAAPSGCYTGARCAIGRLKNAANCDFEGSGAFAGKDLWRSNHSNTHLRGITATGANFTDANLSGACLVDANLSGANLTRTNLGGAILCRTTLPDGSIENKDCDSPTACCPTCIEFGRACGGGLGGACCGVAVCTGGACGCPADRPHRCSDGVCRACCVDADCSPDQNCQNGVCVNDCDVCMTTACAHQSVAAAIAAGLTTIHICPGTYPTNLASFPASLTLIGAGSGADQNSNTILDGGNTNRVLNVASGVTLVVRSLRIARGRTPRTGPNGNVGGGIANGGTVTLDGVAVVESVAADAGGGIWNTGTLTLQNGCRVTTNSASGNAGGIRNEGTLIVSGSDVSDNTAGGGVLASGGGIDGRSGMVTLTNSTVERNRAQSGAGINIEGGTVTVNAGGRVNGNIGTGNGGGIRLRSGGTLLLKAGSSVTNNSTGVNGGAMFNDGGLVTIEDGAVICDNTPNDCVGPISGTCPQLPPGGICPA
jgi:uncharacterized protein YjbI with pentapeptide repeats